MPQSAAEEAVQISLRFCEVELEEEEDALSLSCANL